MELKWLRRYPWTLVFAVLALSIVGTLFVYSASHHDNSDLLTKQFFWISLGFLIFIVTAHLKYRMFLSVSYLLYVVAALLLIVVYFVGETRYGAQRWLHLGPVAIQPSEFAKLATILALANFLGSRTRQENEKRSILAAILFIFVPFFLIVRQPDLGTAILFLPVLGIALFLWGIRFRYIWGALIAGALIVPSFWVLLKEYQRKRIEVFLNPETDPLGAGYTAMQSRIAIGSGGFFGKGYLAGTQSQLHFVPEHHTDFIFCVIGEEWGFIGSLLVLILYGMIFTSAFQVMEQTTDTKAKLLIGGVVGLIFFQIFINIGMSYGLMPIAGITLPLISYGGSSFISTCFGLGLILSIYRERSIF